MKTTKNSSTVKGSSTVKESEVPHDFEIEEVRATPGDLKDFKGFCKRLELKYKAKGAVKIIPPKSFNSGFKELPRNYQLSSIIKRKSVALKSGRDIAYEVTFEERDQMSFGKYYDQLKKKGN